MSNTMKRHYGHFIDGKIETEIQASGLVCLFPLSHAVSTFYNYLFCFHANYSLLFLVTAPLWLKEKYNLNI